MQNLVKKRQCLELAFKTVDTGERLCYNNIQVSLCIFLWKAGNFMGAEINYMTEIKAMYGYFMTRSPGKAAVAMLQALYMINNAERWSEWFDADSDCLSRLMGGYARSTIWEAREKLCSMGRIEYKTGDRNCQKASYKIIPFAKSAGKYKKYNSENVALSVENIVADNADLFAADISEKDMNPNMNPNMKSEASYSYNKTKKNKTARTRDPMNSSSKNPFFDALELRGFDI